MSSVCRWSLHWHNATWKSATGYTSEMERQTGPDFSLSRALFRKYMWAPATPDCVTPIFLKKNWRPFFSHYRLSAVTSSAVSLLFLFFWHNDDFFGHHCRFAFIQFTRVSWLSSPLSFLISVISGMLLCLKNLLVLLWGTFFVGPLFGRTCWTCLNPPLKTNLQ